MPREDVAHLVVLHIAKWASSRDEFDSTKVGNILHNWGASICGRIPMVYSTHT